MSALGRKQPFCFSLASRLCRTAPVGHRALWPETRCRLRFTRYFKLMNLRLTRCLLAALIFATGAAPASAQPAPFGADRQLKSLYDGYSFWVAKEYGSIEDSRGASQPADYLPRVDPATNLARAAYLKTLLAKLDAIPLASLSLDEQTNAAVLRNVLISSLSDARFREWKCRSIRTAISGPISTNPPSSTMPPPTAATSPGCATCRAFLPRISPTCAPGSRAASRPPP